MAYNTKHKRRVSHKQNRRWSETQNTWAVPTKVAGILAFLAVLGIAFAALSHSRDALWEEISKAERKQEVLKEDLAHETRAWNAMKKPSNLVVTLRNNGISMTATPRGSRVAMGGYCLPAGRGPAGRAPTALAANL